MIAPTMLEKQLDRRARGLPADRGRGGPQSEQPNRAVSIYILMTMFQRSSPTQQLLLDTVQRGIKGLNAIKTPISHSTAIQRAVLHPGEGSTRLVEGKVWGGRA